MDKKSKKALKKQAREIAVLRRRTSDLERMLAEAMMCISILLDMKNDTDENDENKQKNNPLTDLDELFSK